MQVTPQTIEETLNRAEAAVSAGEGLADTGFWGVVSEIKRHPELAGEYGPRISEIDSNALRRWAVLVVPLWLGTLLMILATAVGVALVGWAYYLTGLWAVAVFYVGLGALLVTTHGLGHLLVGAIVGIRFEYWFLGPPSFPLKGGVKIDYASYLGVNARSRAWMHAAGAVTTKLVPFALIGAAIAAGLASWAVWGLVIIGVATVLLDVIWSTQRSDWMKFKREMAFAQT